MRVVLQIIAWPGLNPYPAAASVFGPHEQRHEDDTPRINSRLVRGHTPLDGAQVSVSKVLICR